MRRVSLLLPLTAILAMGCGVEDSRDLTVLPAQPVVQVGERLTLQASSEAALAEEPAWEVPSFHGGGFLNSRGFRVTYLAPEGAGTYHLVLRARRSDGTPLRRLVAVQVLPAIQIAPAYVKLAAGATCAFTARVKGAPHRDLLWSVVEPEGGSIAEDGTYTAPGQPGTYHVLATARAFSAVSADAIVRVN